MLNPILQNIKNTLYCALAWFMVALLQFFVLHYFYHLSIIISIVDSFTFYIIFGVLAMNLWYVIRFNPTEKREVITNLINHFALGVVISLIWFYSGYYILSYIFKQNTEYRTFLSDSVPWRIASGFFLYIIVVLGYYLNIYYKNFKEKITKEMTLQSLIKERELSALKAQINPHFLFNSLNSISSLTITDPEKAREMIIKLSQFFRYTLANKEKDMVPLKREIETCNLYMDIEKIRFGEKLSFANHFSENCFEKKLPAMLLQPLYENAIKHSVYESTEKITIETECSFAGNVLNINIRNNFDPDAVSRKGEQIGLANIKNRLKLIFERDDLIRTQISGTYFEVRLKIPQI
jgi:two-component system, LytTR family, sensor kinase